MSGLDIVFLVLLVLSAFGGYRRGAILQAFGLTGLTLGVVAAALVAGRAADTAQDTLTRVAIALGVVLVGAAVGNVLGWLVGSRMKGWMTHPGATRADAFGGAALSVAALILTTWFLALNLANGPFPQLSREIRDSRVVGALDRALPPPPPLLAGIAHAADLLGFPDAFAGLPPLPAPPVDPPGADLVQRAAAAARPSTVEVLGSGCSAGYLNEGSGFAVAHGYVVTNAHVVAGTSDQTVVAGEERLPAIVVAFDPTMDLAVLRVPDLVAPALALATDEVPRGTGGAVLGFPGGGPMQVSVAAVLTGVDAVGRDVYGRGQIDRRLYELQAEVHPGNSGGPFVLADGHVAGVVFATSTLDAGIAFAITADQVAAVVDGAVGRTQPAGTGSCAA